MLSLDQPPCVTQRAVLVIRIDSEFMLNSLDKHVPGPGAPDPVTATVS